MLIELMQNVGLPIYSMPEHSYVFVWNENNTVLLMQEYGGEMLEVDIKVFEITGFELSMSQKFNMAYETARKWAHDIRNEYNIQDEEEDKETDDDGSIEDYAYDKNKDDKLTD